MWPKGVLCIIYLQYAYNLVFVCHCLSSSAQKSRADLGFLVYDGVIAHKTFLGPRPLLMSHARGVIIKGIVNVCMNVDLALSHRRCSTRGMCSMELWSMLLMKEDIINFLRCRIFVMDTSFINSNCCMCYKLNSVPFHWICLWLV